MPLITFEGIDGCGKSTQINLLEEYFREKRVNFSVFREPGGTFIGEKIRSVLLDKENEDMSAKAEFMLYASSRAQLTEKEIKPRLNSGEYVVLDRYVDSSVAYQGFGRGLGKRMIILINEFATDILYPDLTFYLEIDKKTFEKRLYTKKDGKDRLESEGWEFMQKVMKGYNSLKNSKRFVVLDGRLEPKQIFKSVIDNVEKHFAL